MTRALYRKYRSRSLDEVVGQDHITRTLHQALKSGRIRHAYLFSGPKGVGKTSVARILAHEVNKLPYGDDATHLDIIEIDAASNRRIDEVRDLRDKVHTAPTSAPYKVYIIDEVHMLTREAFNALLKTLEEPPEHVIFILATTEAHKLPETITSRTQHFTFRLVSPKELSRHLAEIAKKEKIKIEPDALELLAEYGQGSVRDSISLLDQLSGEKQPITKELVYELVGLPKAELLEGLLTHIASGDLAASLQSIDELDHAGVNFALAAKLLADTIRESLASGKAADLELLRSLLDVPGSSEPRRMFELAVLEASSKNTQAKAPPDTAKPAVEVAEAEPNVDELIIDQLPPASTPDSAAKELDSAQWQQVLNVVKSKAPAIYTALRLAQPEISNDQLLLYFEFPLHQKKINSAASLNLIGQAFQAVTGQQLVISTAINKLKPAGRKTPDSEEIQDISNIFGGAEVLES